MHLRAGCGQFCEKEIAFRTPPEVRENTPVADLPKGYAILHLHLQAPGLPAFPQTDAH
jgi:hypothetical protein